MPCSHWDELKFARFCAGGLSQKQLNQFYAHMDECEDCRDRFITAWNILTEESSSQDRDWQADEDAVERIINSRRWRTYQENIARHHAQRVRASLPFAQSDQPPAADSSASVVKLSSRRQSPHAL